ncbi:D-alanyl-D-alanine carboxypeptidase/D-alanyl-D-alanine endopeptidase [Demequina zhanjiangensis]|uniref:D-alanyl-D-alanine carboxypeptidase/D-alanyl-D-alanine-endopeptidase n=1 Tax=Demequina zhanjiangensis TaxID=3051659 RepID=A0ABT8FZ63_9MICO|nr:D-alanyl-D-alanine carboxypeptidase/D-alanyl-D-alanine-endopeptidase [Demequina sp. SYSU T00b26]MDN4471999.1 D-alanyl-D-alanine carboxypeptidase/D-alanyl-D-alanine-endopeptidase [Demequina sp. SYSU T00b26]
MGRRLAIAIAVPSVLALGYLAADVADVVPGFLTAEPAPPVAAPFLTASPAPSSSMEGLALTDGTGADAPLPSPYQLQILAQELRDDPRTGTSTNVSVIDLVTGEPLADLDADEPQVPASTTKVLTAVAAATALGPDHTLSTDAAWDPGARTLTLVAGGDILLAEGYGHHGDLGTASADEIAAFGGPSVANGYAGLADLADAVVDALGTDLGTVTVAVDTSDYPGPAYPESWPDYALQQGYAGRVTGIAIDEGRLTDDAYAQRSDDPVGDTVDAFAALLEDRGIDVGTTVTRTASSGASVVASVESAPMSDIVTYLLRDSDNTVAEQVGRILALETGRKATPSGAAAAVTEALDGLGVDTTGLQLYDGAGFSDRNRITPNQLVDALRAAAVSDDTSGILDWLPVMGVEGTVADRAGTDDVVGRGLAKTGSLTGVTALAGLIETADGRWLVFATLADGMPPGQPRPRAAIDEFIGALAGCGCEG